MRAKRPIATTSRLAHARTSFEWRLRRQVSDSGNSWGVWRQIDTSVTRWRRHACPLPPPHIHTTLNVRARHNYSTPLIAGTGSPVSRRCILATHSFTNNTYAAQYAEQGLPNDTVPVRLSVCLSVPVWAHSSKPAVGPSGRRYRSMLQQRRRSGSATLSAYVYALSWTQTCFIKHVIAKGDITVKHHTDNCAQLKYNRQK